MIEPKMFRQPSLFESLNVKVYGHAAIGSRAQAQFDAWNRADLALERTCPCFALQGSFDGSGKGSTEGFERGKSSMLQSLCAHIPNVWKLPHKHGRRLPDLFPQASGVNTQSLVAKVWVDISGKDKHCVKAMPQSLNKALLSMRQFLIDKQATRACPGAAETAYKTAHTFPCTDRLATTSWNLGGARGRAMLHQTTVFGPLGMTVQEQTRHITN